MPVDNQFDSSLGLNDLDLVKFLISSDAITNELKKFGIVSGDALSKVVTHLDSTEVWVEYKTNIEKQFKQAESDLLKLSSRIGDLFYTSNQNKSERDAVAKQKADLEAQSSRRYAEMKILAAQKAFFSSVDTLISNSRVQTLLFARIELAKYYPDYIKADLVYRNAVKHGNIEKQDEISHYTADVIKRDHHLGDLLKTIELLEKESHAAKHENQHEHESALEDALEVVESLTEFSESATELADITKEWADFVKESSHVSHEGVKDAVNEGGKVAQGIRAIPLVSEFLYGINCLREAYAAYNNPHAEHRDVKIRAGIIGGVASIGVGIVGSLLLAGVGALATATAIFAAPIVLAAITVGIYSVALYRDTYIYQHSKIKFEKAMHEIDVLDNELFRAKEVIISNYLSHSDDPSLVELKKIQDEINQDRNHLYSEIHGNKDSAQLTVIKNRLNDNVRKRNEVINGIPNLNDKMNVAIRQDSRVIRLRLERCRLSSAIMNLQQARFTAGVQTGLSALTIVGVGLALAAVCVTGVGALVVGLIATTVLAGIAIVRVHDAITKKSQANIKSAKKDRLPEESIHSSELGIEKRLMHNHHEEIAHALIHQSVQQSGKPKIDKLKVVAIDAVALAPVQAEVSEEKRGSGPSSH